MSCLAWLGRVDSVLHVCSKGVVDPSLSTVPPCLHLQGAVELPRILQLACSMSKGSAPAADVLMEHLHAGTAHLVSFVTPETADVDAAVAELRQSVPDYMVRSIYPLAACICLALLSTPTLHMLCWPAGMLLACGTEQLRWSAF